MTTVLLADDHPFMRAGVEAVLRDSQFNVVATAATGQEALEKLSEHDPELCILDIRMPAPSGVEVLQTMRERGDRRPVVLLTAELEDAALVAAVRADVNGIVLKHVAEDALLDCLEAVAAGQQAIPADLMAHAQTLLAKGEPSHPLGNLTPRERQIAELVGGGLRNRDIASSLGMTEGTVKVYLHVIYQKLDIDNRTELALIAHGRRDLIR
jgi:two-component system nitrate/nitrite response regulator NarL